MRITVVPAQITNVEDKIAGNLSFTQLLLMIVPVFISAALFVFLPPFTSFKVYKLVIASVIAIVFMTLAIRIKGRLIVQWTGILGRYNARPRYYIFDKNNFHSRVPVELGTQKQPEMAPAEVATSKQELPRVTQQELLAFESMNGDEAANFYFKRTKKGGLSVRIKEAA